MIHPELAELKTWERSEYAAGYGERLSAIRKLLKNTAIRLLVNGGATVWLGRNRRLSKVYQYMVQTSENHDRHSVLANHAQSTRTSMLLFRHPLRMK